MKKNVLIEECEWKIFNILSIIIYKLKYSMHIVLECVGFHIHSKVTLLLDKVEQLINEIRRFHSRN